MTRQLSIPAILVNALGQLLEGMATLNITHGGYDSSKIVGDRS